jgi:transposase
MGKASVIELQAFYPESLQIIKIDDTPQQITITLRSRKHNHECLKCGEEAQTYHATYMRSVQDLPIFQKNVRLQIKAYDYYCQNKDCEVVSFAESYDGFIGRSDRMTDRLENFIRTLALETNCEGAAAICKELGIRTSGDTIIRILLKLCDAPAAQCGEVIGVDDFAYRKGQTYCTVICDGITRKPVGILDGRDGATLKEWLAKNKQVKKVTRDRAGAYAKAISDSLPEAMQIADRFHLHQNLSAAIKEALKSEIPKKILIPDDIDSVVDIEQPAHEDKKN